MKLLTIEMSLSDNIVKEYMSLPIEQRAGYIQELFRRKELKLENFTTEFEGEFPEEESE